MWKSTIFVCAGGIAIGSIAYPQIKDAVRDLVDTARSGVVAVTNSEPATTKLIAAQSGSAPQGTRIFSAGQPLLAASSSLEQNEKSQRANPPSVAPFVVPGPVLAASGEGQPVRRLASSRPADEDARRELVRDLQRELKRVGCYDGEISGTWSPGSKKAMGAFTERVNATLPLEEPDYIFAHPCARP